VLPEDGDRAGPGLTVYSVPHEMTSPLWARAFAKGCGAVVSKGEELLPGNVALFGSPARWDLLTQARSEGRDWYYGDHAYFGRHQYFRITRNAWQHDAGGVGDAARFDELGLRVRNWKTGGRYVLLCPQSPKFFRLHGLDCETWIDETQQRLRQHTDREVRVRFKTSRRTFEQELKNAWAVVVYTSVCGVHAALEGVACFATAPCASLSFGSGDLSRIENPVRPDNRHEMACVLAANQWTLHEMASGKAWSKLHEHEAMARLDPA
jgi:hypothetical protein